MLERVTQTGDTSKRAAVNEALAEYVARRRQRRILDLVGEVEWDATRELAATGSSR